MIIFQNWLNKLFPINRIPTWLVGSLLLFLLWDITYTALQFYRAPIDGDVTNLAMPVDSYRPVFEDPFGFEIIRTGEGHGGSNRYFSHLALYQFYNQAPLLWQRLVSPIESIYFADTTLKLLIHLMMIGILMGYARRASSVAGQLPHRQGILLLAFTVSLFQTYGNVSVMGIIDPATSFNFFYSLPMVLLLVVLFPFWSWLVTEQYPKHDKTWIGIICLFAVPLCLSGPLISPCLLLLGGGIMLLRMRSWSRSGSINLRGLDAGLLILICCSLYSFYLGAFNVENGGTWLPYGERYVKLVEGFARILYRKPGFTLLLLLLGTNYYLLSRTNQDFPRLLKTIKFLAVFSIVYLLLLPLGGYREYRPYFIRWDTLLPVTISVMIALLATSAVLLRALPVVKSRNLLIGIVAITVFFTFQDLYSPRADSCERAALEVLSKAEAEVVELTQDCSVLSWATIRDKNESYSKGVMLQRWGITERRKLYYTPVAE